MSVIVMYNVIIICTHGSGTVDAALKITLTDALKYATNKNYSVVHDAVGLSSTEYILSYDSAGVMSNHPGHL